MAIAAVVLLTLLPLGLSACSEEKIVNLLNWGDYLDPELKQEFKSLTGITIREIRVESNEEMYEKLSQKNCPFDLCIPSDYVVEGLIEDGLLARLDKKNIPNLRNIGEEYLDRAFDPGNVYSVPYTWGVLGVLYNKALIDEEDVGSWEILWNIKYSGEIYMYDSLRDTMAVALGRLGYSMNTTDPIELKEAGDSLIELLPAVKGWGTDENKDAMLAGDGAIAVLFNGDAMWCTEEGGGNELGFFVPEGSNIFIDNLVIPVGAKHKKNAEKFINFLLEPETAVRNIEYVGYSTPNTAAFELLDEKWKNNPVFVVPKEQLQTLEFQHDLGDAAALYEEQWERIGRN